MHSISLGIILRRPVLSFPQYIATSLSLHPSIHPSHLYLYFLLSFNLTFLPSFLPFPLSPPTRVPRPLLHALPWRRGKEKASLTGRVDQGVISRGTSHTDAVPRWLQPPSAGWSPNMMRAPETIRESLPPPPVTSMTAFSFSCASLTRASLSVLFDNTLRNSFLLETVSS